MISDKNRNLINRVIESFEWGSIVSIYRIMERGVGNSTIKIPGITRIPYKKVTADDIKKEITTVVEYVMDNNLPHLEYEMWDIMWIDGEWEVEIELPNMSDDQEDDMFLLPFTDSRLEIKFVPQKAVSHEALDISEEEELDEIRIEESDEVVLNRILEKSIQNEKYELASKLSEIINEFYRKIKKETKIKNNGKNQKTQ